MASLLTILIILITYVAIIKIFMAVVEISDKHKTRKEAIRHRNKESKEWDSSKALAIPEEPPKVYESYDHPAPPIALLGASVCRAPVGYGWEITAVTNEAGNPALRLAMLDLKTSTIVDAIERDMVIVRRWQYADDDTYAAFYRRAEAIEAKKRDHEYYAAVKVYNENLGFTFGHYQKYPTRFKPDGKLAGKVMMANLITPMVDWAALLTLRYIVEHPDDTKCNYMLIESMEGAK